MKALLKHLKVRIWLIVASVLLVILIAVDIVLGAVIPGVMDAVFGADRTVLMTGTGDTQYYKADDGITSKSEAKAAERKAKHDERVKADQERKAKRAAEKATKEAEKAST